MPSPSAPTRWLPPLIAGVVLLALACVLGAIILELGNGPFLADDAWNSFLAGLTSTALLGFSWTMNVLGGGWVATYVVPLGLALLFVVLRRPWAGAYVILASAASAGAVQVLKHLYGRARPEEIIVVSDFGSFPSGHTANAATLAVILVVLFPRLWVGLAGLVWVVLMAFSRTYLHAHWLSDTIGGAFAGAGAALVVAAALAVPFAREAARRQMRAAATATEPPQAAGRADAVAATTPPAPVRRRVVGDGSGAWVAMDGGSGRGGRGGPDGEGVGSDNGDGGGGDGGGGGGGGD